MREGDVVGGRYRLTALLGRGAMGQVFCATDARLRRDVAVKVVDLTQTTDRTVAERFRREAIAIAQLNHPGIVTVFDAGSDTSSAWLVMELLGGRPLSTLVREQGALPQRQAVQIAGCLAEALVATHRIGVVHRDIKPGNVMVDGDAVKLLDFGIALVSLDAEANLTAPATTLGTAAYMSPEQALGRRATAASDVYALGGVLVSMLTGQPPYPGDNAIQVAQRHISDPVVSVRARRPEVSGALDDLIVRMLAKDPAARPDASVVAQGLAHLAAQAAPTSTAVFPVGAPAGTGAVAALNVSTPPPATTAPAPTAVLPAQAPASTAVMPAASVTDPPPSAVRVPTSPDAGRPALAGWMAGLRTAALWLVIVIAALVVFAVAWFVGTQVAHAQPRAAASSGSTTSGGFAFPAWEDFPSRVALAGADAAVSSLLEGSGVDEGTAASLRTAWSSARQDILAGGDAASALSSFREAVDEEREAGHVGAVEAALVSGAVGAVEVLLPS